jgi:type I restriction enzyme M protein
MTRNVFQNIEQIVSSLWEAADQLRINSKLTSSGYDMLVLGVTFLRHAANRSKAAIVADQAAGKMLKCRVMMLPREAQFDELLNLPVADWSCPWIWDNAQMDVDQR